MSYLDVPRLHFSGLFFTGPSTVNNRIANYNPNTPLEQSGVYQPIAGWNPLGVAQWWLEECTVLSAVGSTGAPVLSSDTVIGAAVQSPSPKTPMVDASGGGYYDLAKMVDLDVQQQIRSALYGVRIACILPNGAGFQGLMTVPELRQLNTRIPGVQGSWGAVGQWMGTLQNVVWQGDISSSPFLMSLKNGNYPGLNVKLTIDLHQNNPANVFTSGDQFCYGRVLGSIGPAVVSELPQVLPGRCLQTFSASTPLTSLTATNDTPPQTRQRVADKGVAIGEARAARSVNALAAAAPDPWNPAFAIIRQVGNQTLLSIDIGGCIYLNYQGSPPTTSDGTFEVDSGIVVGVVNKSTNQFTPFVNGNISIAPQYQPLLSTAKNTTLVKNSCVFSFPITTADGLSYQNNPLAIQVNGTTVAQENTDGSWMDVSVSSQRLECATTPQSAQSVLMVRRYGNPVANQTPPVTHQIKLPVPPGGPTSDVSIQIGNTDSNGLALITTSVKASSLNLPADRQPLDSEVCLVFMNDLNGQPIGDGPSEGANLSVLLFNFYQAPANPTWNDVGAIFGAYARLYPGMRSRLDIGDEATVVGDVNAVIGHMNLPISDPAYMPVTRDLSPAKMVMIISWLKTQVKP